MRGQTTAVWFSRIPILIIAIVAVVINPYIGLGLGIIVGLLMRQYTLSVGSTIGIIVGLLVSNPFIGLGIGLIIALFDRQHVFDLGSIVEIIIGIVLQMPLLNILIGGVLFIFNRKYTGLLIGSMVDLVLISLMGDTFSVAGLGVIIAVFLEVQ